MTIQSNIDGMQCTSTDPGLDKLLDHNTFPDCGRNFFPVVIMVASAGGSGKDTFIEMVRRHFSYDDESVSTVDQIKCVYDILHTALHLTYDDFYDKEMNPAEGMVVLKDKKSEEYRQFLHDVKDAWTKLNDGPVLYCLAEYVKAARSNIILNGDPAYSPPYGAIFVNNRDLDTYTTMKDWCYQMGTLCIGVKVDGTPQASDFSNDCDSNVDKIPYDIIIENKSTLEALDRKAKIFAQLLELGISRYGIEVDDRLTFEDCQTLGLKNISQMKKYGRDISVE
ncbi:MAG: hypothetical protein NC114_06505 [Ruminococcus flavefaciens]|nr:hypothetical protein [Ruminococcus flavefaciens]